MNCRRRAHVRPNLLFAEAAISSPSSISLYLSLTGSLVVELVLKDDNKQKMSTYPTPYPVGADTGANLYP
jgi:hypothetical protein